MLEGVGATENNLAGICLSLAGSFTGEKIRLTHRFHLRNGVWLIWVLCYRAISMRRFLWRIMQRLGQLGRV